MKILIQAHPARADIAEGLRDCLDTGEIVYDPDPDARRSPWRTYRTCLHRGLEIDEPFLILQEDTLVCDNFVEGVERAALARPDNPIAFFCPAKPPAYTNAIYRAREAESAFASLPLGSWVPVVATLWPVAVAARLLHWWEETPQPSGWLADDEICGRFLAAHTIEIFASVPSLVEHPDTVPSVMNHHHRNGDGLDPSRRAYFFIGDDESFGCDALNIDWG